MMKSLHAARFENARCVVRKVNTSERDKKLSMYSLTPVGTESKLWTVKSELFICKNFSAFLLFLIWVNKCKVLMMHFFAIHSK